MAVKLTDNLKTQYQQLFNNCVIKLDKINVIDNIVSKITNNKNTYQKVSKVIDTPWYVIAVIHNMESSLNFKRHIHNGDPLTGRTFHVPEGRPVKGEPPFSWEESAIDAFNSQKFDKWSDWTLPGVLYKIEAYNGWGYRLKHPEVLSPYLWSFSNHYKAGKYVADGTWSDTAVSKQIGAAVLLRRLVEREEIAFEKKPNKLKKPLIFFSNKVVPNADKFQKFLNSFEGINLLEDGKPGEKTSAANKLVAGNYLIGDPRYERQN